MRLALVCLSLFLLMGLSGACHYVLADEDDFAGMNEEWLRWFPANPPARQGAKLPARVPGLKVSIAAIAEA